MKALRATLLFPIVFIAIAVTYICMFLPSDIADLWRELKA